MPDKFSQIQNLLYILLIILFLLVLAYWALPILSVALAFLAGIGATLIFQRYWKQFVNNFFDQAGVAKKKTRIKIEKEDEVIDL